MSKVNIIDTIVHVIQPDVHPLITNEHFQDHFHKQQYDISEETATAWLDGYKLGKIVGAARKHKDPTTFSKFCGWVQSQVKFKSRRA